MEDKLIQFIKDNIDIEKARHVYSKMVICRCSLDYQDINLYNTINELINNYCLKNNIENTYKVYIIFEKLFS